MGKSILIKIGGRAATQLDTLETLVKEISALSKDFDILMVHGGGAEVSKVTEVFGLEPRFIDGVRQTSPAEMDIVEMVLAGKMNKMLVRMFEANKHKAAGICGADGASFVSQALAGDTRTGKVVHVDTALIKLLFSGGYTPVMASTSMDKKGDALNINADEAALHIAMALKVDHLIYFSDIPGVLKDSEVIPQLNEKIIEDEIAAGVIAGGMIPKVRSAIEGLKGGVKAVIIGQYTKQGDLAASIDHKNGSTIAL